MNVDPLVDATGQTYVYTGDDPVNQTDPGGLDYYLQITPNQARLLGEVLNGAADLDQLLAQLPLPELVVDAIHLAIALGAASGQGNGLIQSANAAQRLVKAAGLGRTNQPKLVGYVDLDIVTFHILGIDTGAITGTINSTPGTRRNTSTAVVSDDCGPDGYTTV